MLNNKARIILFWFTIALMIAVAVLAAITILRACGGPMGQEPPPTITPAEISLCLGEQHQFAVANGGDITWEATGGTITEGGLFTAGDTPGDHTVTATRNGSRRTAAIVHIVACTPTPTTTPAPSPTPAPTATTAPSEGPEGASPPSEDAQGDVGEYETGALVESHPAGVDIRAANINPDLRVVLEPADSTPPQLADFAADGEILLWFSLYEAIPDPPGVFMNWLFVIDTDGDRETGRPAGSARINPDLGDEVAVGLSYDPATGTYEPYSLIWNADQGDWASGPEVRHRIDDSRTVVGLALSRQDLQESGVVIVGEAIKGRTAAETYTAAGERVIDFYPDRPE